MLVALHFQHCLNCYLSSCTTENDVVTGYFLVLQIIVETNPNSTEMLKPVNKTTSQYQIEKVETPQYTTLKPHRQTKLRHI